MKLKSKFGSGKAISPIDRGDCFAEAAAASGVGAAAAAGPDGNPTADFMEDFPASSAKRTRGL